MQAIANSPSSCSYTGEMELQLALLCGVCQLEHELSDLLNRKVDLVMKDELKPRIGERILEEVVYL